MPSAAEVWGPGVGSRTYRVIYADPPWAFKTFSVKGHGRSAEAHYDCMSLDAIRALPVGDVADQDALLLLWARDPMVPQALSLIEAWGFEFKTVGFYWAKLNKSAPRACITKKDFFTGLGYWTRGNVEQCLLATRGKPIRRSKAVRKLVIAPRREHSRKPDEMYQHIEELIEGPYLELFSRAGRPGWDSWGSQTGLFDEGQVETRRRSSYSKPRDMQSAAKATQKSDQVRDLEELWGMPNQRDLA
jgi:N6-adenosine-specific RNA methylase IME4